MASRRGFLKMLGLGGVAGVIPTTAALGASQLVEDRTALNFMCGCGESLVAEVPAEVGGKVDLPCGCGMIYGFEWMGDHFKTVRSIDSVEKFYGHPDFQQDSDRLDKFLRDTELELKEARAKAKTTT